MENKKLLNLSSYLVLLKKHPQFIDEEGEINIPKGLTNNIKNNFEKIKSDLRKASITNNNNIADNKYVAEKEIVFVIENTTVIIAKIKNTAYYDGINLYFSDLNSSLKTLKFADIDYGDVGVEYNKISSVINNIRKTYKTTYENIKEDYLVNFYELFYKPNIAYYLKTLLESSFNSLAINFMSNAYTVEFLENTFTSVDYPISVFDNLIKPVYVDFNQLKEYEIVDEIRKKLCDKSKDLTALRESIDQNVEENIHKIADEDFDQLSLEMQKIKKSIIKLELFNLELQRIEDLEEEERELKEQEKLQNIQKESEFDRELKELLNENEQTLLKK